MIVRNWLVGKIRSVLILGFEWIIRRGWIIKGGVVWGTGWVGSVSRGIHFLGRGIQNVSQRRIMAKRFSWFFNWVKTTGAHWSWVTT